MNRSQLIRKIREEAARQGVSVKEVQGARHDILWPGSVKIPIRRHAEIGQRTTQDILH